MSLKSKFILIAVLTSFAFWIPIFSLFSITKGISNENTLFIISIYSFAVVFLEYPTGIFGDYFSHKTSVCIGYALTALVMFSIFFIFDYTSLLSFAIAASLGVTFISGSDEAFRFSLLKENYKTTYPTIKTASTIATLFGISTGTILYQIAPEMPFIANGVAILCAFFLTLSIPDKTNKTDVNRNSNPFKLAFHGISTVIRNQSLLIAILSVSILGLIIINIKWIAPELFIRANIDTINWGILITLFYASRLLGTLLYKKFSYIKALGLLAILLLALSVISWGTSLQAYILIPIITLGFIALGYIETHYEIELQNHANNNVRASTSSLANLLKRLFSGAHLSILGYLIGIHKFEYFGYITAIFVIALIFPIVFQKFHITRKTA